MYMDSMCLYKTLKATFWNHGFPNLSTHIYSYKVAYKCMHLSLQALGQVCMCIQKHARIYECTRRHKHTQKQRQRLAPGIEKYTSLLVSSVASRTQQSSREVQSKTEGKIKHKTKTKIQEVKSNNGQIQETRIREKKNNNKSKATQFGILSFFLTSS